MVEQFVELVRKYVALVDALPGLTAREFLLECAVLLPQIYSLSHQLPDVDLSDTEVLEHEPAGTDLTMSKIMTLLGQYDVYSEVFDPVTETDAIRSTLSDDLSCIYGDLKRALTIFDLKVETSRSEAIWDWKFQMQIHWGHHVVRALRPIHSLVYHHLNPEFQDETEDA